jgi:hypothetical protein
VAEPVELKLNWVHETAAAYGVTEDDPDDPVVWLPKSQCEVDRSTASGLGNVCTFTVPEWLAIDKGLV